MSPQTSSSSHKSRHPKPGLGFALVRAIGWVFKVAGWLLVGVAIAGFIIMLAKMSPELIRALGQSSESKFAGLVFLLSLTYLLIFPLLGLVGATLAGIGFLFSIWGTNRVNNETNIKLVSAHDTQIREQDPS